MSRVFDGHKKITSYIAVIADITKRKKAEINLKNQILYSQQIFQSIPEMIIITDRDLRITFVNRRAQGNGPTDRIQHHRPERFTPCCRKNPSKAALTNLSATSWKGGTGINRINVLNPFLEEETYVDLVDRAPGSGQHRHRQHHPDPRHLGMAQPDLSASGPAGVHAEADQCQPVCGHLDQRGEPDHHLESLGRKNTEVSFAEAFGKNLSPSSPSSTISRTPSMRS